MFKSKKEKITYNYLDLTPQPLYKHEINDNGLIDVLVPKFTDKFLSKLLMPRIKSPYIKANLDELGSATWSLMDGATKVDFIVEKLIEQFGDNINPAAERTTAFLTQLYRNGFITFLEFNKGEK